MTAKVLLFSTDYYGTRRLMAQTPLRLSYRIMVVATKAEALFHLRTDNVAVLAADEGGVEDEALALLEQASRELPEIPRMFLASDVDLPTAIRLVNRVGLFRLLPKPTHIDDFSIAVEAAITAGTSRTIGQQVSRIGQAKTPPPSHMDGLWHDSQLVLYTEEGEPLSRREKEILVAVVEGKKPAEIARTFFISVHTARNHIKALYRKLSVHSQVELIAKVLKTDTRSRRAG